MSRISCWMTTVAFRFAASFFKRSIDATVCARSALKLGTPPASQFSLHCALPQVTEENHRNFSPGTQARPASRFGGMGA